MSGSSKRAVRQSIAETWVAPDPAITPSTPRWFAIQTRPRFEKKVAAQLGHKNVNVYLPLRTEHRRWSDRQKTVTVPLFPAYAFVHISASREARQPLLQTAGLIRFVSFGGTLMAVPEKQITDLQLLLQKEVPYSLYPFVHAGQRVRIRGGCLDGLEGLLVHEKGKLLISIAAIQRSLAIEIHGYELELA